MILATFTIPCRLGCVLGAALIKEKCVTLSYQPRELLDHDEVFPTYLLAQREIGDNNSN